MAKQGGNPSVETIEREMARLSERLGLLNEQQDWGIINGSDERFEEFMREYRSDHLTVVERSALAGLVLASANERLATKPDPDLQEFAQLLRRLQSDARWEYDYWRGLEGPGFPLGEWLRRQPL